MVNGTQSVLIEYREGLCLRERYELTLSCQQPIDVYLKALLAPTAVSIEPSEFNFVATMKKQTFITISSENFPQLFHEIKFILRLRTLFHHEVSLNVKRNKWRPCTPAQC
jgi:hypothetical protein